MKYIAAAYCVIAIGIIGVCIFGIIKTKNTYKKRIIIIDAIYKYAVWCIKNHVKAEVNYTDIESYDQTDKRWLDWGYTNILPKEKFEIIEPYIEGACPSCFGKPLLYHHRAENGCEGCKFEARCDVAREREMTYDV